MRSSRRRVLAAASLTAAALTVSQLGASASAGPKDVAAGTRLAARTNPAVQLIQQLYRGNVVVPKVKVNKTFKALLAKARQNARTGKLPADNHSQLKWVLAQVSSDVNLYLDPARQTRAAQSYVDTLCTGWWMTPNGHMVTGAHCVGLPKARLYAGLGSKVLPKINEDDAVAFLKKWGTKAALTPEMAATTLELFNKFNSEHMRVTRLKHTMYVISVKNVATPLSLVAKGKGWPGEDFALLKMKGARNLPTVPLGRDTDVRVGDVLYINGFPGPITFDRNLDVKSRLYPTLTEGAYNAKRTSADGVPYIQSQAPSYRGNSGGPVFSKDGRVIGILIAGTVDDKGIDAENHSYILPVSVVWKHLAAAGVKPLESATTRIYNAALDDFFAGRYRAALPKFRQAKALYPQHPYVGAFISDSRKAIAAGKSR